MTLRTLSGEEVTFIDERSNHLSNVIFFATTRTIVWKGCEAYLAYVIDTKKAEPSLSDIPTICDYPDMFPEELPGLPPQREIEFGIDVVSSATLASITPYKMAMTPQFSGVPLTTVNLRKTCVSHIMRPIHKYS